MSLSADPFNRVAGVPASVTAEGQDEVGRQQRVQWIGRLAQDLLAGRMPDQEAALFVGGALAAWLEHGGPLEKRYLRVVKAKSHRTPAAIWQRMKSVSSR